MTDVPGAHWVQALLPNDAHAQWERKEEAIADSHYIFQVKSQKKMKTIHQRKSSHKPYNINSSHIALIQFAGKVNLSHNIPLFAQCLRNFPLLCLFLMYGPFDLHIAHTGVQPLKTSAQNTATTGS